MTLNVNRIDSSTISRICAIFCCSAIGGRTKGVEQSRVGEVDLRLGHSRRTLVKVLLRSNCGKDPRQHTGDNRSAVRDKARHLSGHHEVLRSGRNMNHYSHTMPGTGFCYQDIVRANFKRIIVPVVAGRNLMGPRVPAVPRNGSCLEKTPFIGAGYLPLLTCWTRPTEVPLRNIPNGRASPTCRNCAFIHSSASYRSAVLDLRRTRHGGESGPGIDRERQGLTSGGVLRVADADALGR